MTGLYPLAKIRAFAIWETLLDKSNAVFGLLNFFLNHIPPCLFLSICL